MATERYREQGFGIVTIDTGLARSGLVASHLIIEQGVAAFVDVGVATRVETLLAALRHYHVAAEAVAYVIVTHVHLDHAGAVGVLLQQLPNARLVVHPRGARHMIDPSRLIAGAAAVYGEAEMHATFGEILPVDGHRVIEAPDGTVIDLKGRALLCVDTPGHARHHLCVVDESSRGIFTGDAFGLSYRALGSANGPFIIPTTTPVQFDPEAMHASIDRLMQYRPQRMFLTHFGCVQGVASLAADLHRRIDEMVRIAQGVRGAAAQRHRALLQALTEWTLRELAQHGCTLSDEEAMALLAMDIELNAQGLGCWLNQKES